MILLTHEDFLQAKPGTLFSFLLPHPQGSAVGFYLKTASWEEAANGERNNQNQGFHYRALMPLPYKRPEDGHIGFALQPNAEFRITLEEMQQSFAGELIYTDQERNFLLNILAGVTPGQPFAYEIGVNPSKQMMLLQFNQVTTKLEMPVVAWEEMIKNMISRVNECKTMGGKIMIFPGNTKLPPS